MERPLISAPDIWSKFGITEHFGGYFATDELIKRCGGIKPEQKVLVAGCGTGYTPLILAKRYKAYVTATDIDTRMLDLTKERIARGGMQDNIRPQIADLQDLPFDKNTFDAVLAESVLVFTDPQKSASEMFRVLKGGGVFGVNEITVSQRPPDSLISLFKQLYPTPVQILEENEWKQVFEEAGFENVTSAVYKFSPWKNFLSHLKIDGPGKILASLYQSVADPELRSLFFRQGILRSTVDLLRYINYGLYTGNKPS